MTDNNIVGEGTVAAGYGHTCSIKILWKCDCGHSNLTTVNVDEICDVRYEPFEVGLGCMSCGEMVVAKITEDMTNDTV